MSNRLFQGVIHQMRDAVDRTIGVIDETGTIISCSELGKIGEVISNASQIFAEDGDRIVNGCTYRSFGSHMQAEYAVFIDGEDELAGKYADICCVALSNIKQCYDEKFDRGNFVKNVILDNILPGDIAIKARELRFNSDAVRTVLLIRITEHNDSAAFDVIQNLFPDKTKDFVININENEIALVKEVRSNIETKDLEKLARSISDSLTTDLYIHAYVGIGTTVTGVKELARSFKEAQIALEVGKVFDTEKTIVSYDNLGIGKTYLSASHDPVRYVHARGVQARLDRQPRSGDAVHHSAFLREQPQRLRDLPQALCPPQHSCLQTREDQEAHRP